MDQKMNTSVYNEYIMVRMEKVMIWIYSFCICLKLLTLLYFYIFQYKLITYVYYFRSLFSEVTIRFFRIRTLCIELYFLFRFPFLAFKWFDLLKWVVGPKASHDIAQKNFLTTQYCVLTPQFKTTDLGHKSSFLLMNLNELFN